VVLRVTPPLVPLILKLKVPVEVDEFVPTVNVDDPWPVTELGLKLALELSGNPRTLNVTVPLKPLIAAMVAVYVVLLPRVTVCEDGEAKMEKEFTTKVTVVECVRLGVVLVPVIVSV
jgi:hypothetical protein